MWGESWSSARFSLKWPSLGDTKLSCFIPACPAWNINLQFCFCASLSHFRSHKWHCVSRPHVLIWQDWITTVNLSSLPSLLLIKVCLKGPHPPLHWMHCVTFQWRVLWSTPCGWIVFTPHWTDEHWVCINDSDWGSFYTFWTDLNVYFAALFQTWMNDISDSEFPALMFFWATLLQCHDLKPLDDLSLTRSIWWSFCKAAH